MNDHNEKLFQRINQTRAKLVGELRVALNGAGLRERSAVVVASTKYDNMQGLQAAYNNVHPDAGYEIERIIQAATAIRKALESFDTSILEVKA